MELRNTNGIFVGVCNATIVSTLMRNGEGNDAVTVHIMEDFEVLCRSAETGKEARLCGSIAWLSDSDEYVLSPFEAEDPVCEGRIETRLNLSDEDDIVVDRSYVSSFQELT